MLKVVPAKKKTLTGDNQVTGCCNASMDVVKVGNELLLRCHNCGEYIGNVVDREIALIEAHYIEFIKAALSDAKVELIPLEEQLEEIYPTYIQYCLKFAKQAARTALKGFLRGEEP